VEAKLRLPEFKNLFSQLKRGIPWVDHLILGLLVWLEEYFLNARIENEVSKAVEEYELLDPPIVSLPKPLYSEVDSPTSELLPEMRLQAPWRRD
jgi:hypothetical protein